MCPNKCIKIVVATILSFGTAYLISLQPPSTSKFVAVVGVLGIVTLLPLSVFIISFLVSACFFKIRNTVTGKSAPNPIERVQPTDEKASVKVLLLDGDDTPIEYNVLSAPTVLDLDSQIDSRVSVRELFHGVIVSKVEFEESPQNSFAPSKSIEPEVATISSVRGSIISHFKQRQGSEYST